MDGQSIRSGTRRSGVSSQPKTLLSPTGKNLGKKSRNLSGSISNRSGDSKGEAQ